MATDKFKVSSNEDEMHKDILGLVDSVLEVVDMEKSSVADICLALCTTDSILGSSGLLMQIDKLMTADIYLLDGELETLGLDTMGLRGFKDTVGLPRIQRSRLICDCLMYILVSKGEIEQKQGVFTSEAGAIFTNKQCRVNKNVTGIKESADIICKYLNGLCGDTDTDTELEDGAEDLDFDYESYKKRLRTIVEIIKEYRNIIDNGLDFKVLPTIESLLGVLQGERVKLVKTGDNSLDNFFSEYVDFEKDLEDVDEYSRMYLSSIIYSLLCACLNLLKEVFASNPHIAYYNMQYIEKHYGVKIGCSSYDNFVQPLRLQGYIPEYAVQLTDRLFLANGDFLNTESILGILTMLFVFVRERNNYEVDFKNLKEVLNSDNFK